MADLTVAALTHCDNHQPTSRLRASTMSTPRAFLAVTRLLLECPINSPRSRRRLRIFDLDPSFRWAGFINRCEPLRHDALKPEIANGGKKFVAVAVGVFNILDALSRFAEHPL